MSSYLVTGAAGFIGSKVTAQLLADGHTVVGVDNLNDYYDTRLKLYRLSELAKDSGCEKQFRRKVRKDFKIRKNWIFFAIYYFFKDWKSDWRFGLWCLLMYPLVFERDNFLSQTGKEVKIMVDYLVDYAINHRIFLIVFVFLIPIFIWFSKAFFLVRPCYIIWFSPWLRGQSPLTLSGLRFRFYSLDIEKEGYLDCLFDRHKFDAVIHLAARAGVRASAENPLAYFQTNTTGTQNLLEVMRLHNVRKFVFASTSSLYAGQPTPFTEDLPVNTPVSPYAATKKAAEILAYTYHKLYGFDVAVLRYFTVFGPAGRPDMSVLRFIQALDTGKPLEIFGDGTQTRDWTYIDDIVRGTIAATQTPLGFEIINLGGGTKPPVSLNEVIAFLEKEFAAKAIRHEVSFHAADMDTTSADISKAFRLLQWEPQVTWQEGLRRTVHWYRENREWLRQIKF